MSRAARWIASLARALGACALGAVALSACESPPPLEASCGGSVVELCGPREWAEPSEASMEPPMLPVADFSVEAHIRVRLARCDAAPAPHVIELSALVPDDMPGDGGEPVQLTSLLTLTPGEDGDAPGDDLIDIEVTNPLITTIPEDTDIRLRFAARSTTPAGCTGGVIEIPYRTGPRR